MAESKILTCKEWEEAVLATGIKRITNERLGLGCLILDGYSVVGSSAAGNAGSLSIQIPDGAYGSVFVSSYGNAAFRIEPSGRLSLMSPNLGNYIAGQVYGAVFFRLY